MMVMILLTIERDQIRESEKELYMSVCVYTIKRALLLVIVNEREL